MIFSDTRAILGRLMEFWGGFAVIFGILGEFGGDFEEKF